MEVKEYWRKIRAIAAHYDPEALHRDRNEEDPADRTHLKRSENPVWLMSIANLEKNSHAGQMVLMKPYAAAERIFAQTHREATEAEIAAELQRRETVREQILADEEIRKGNHAKDIGTSIANAILAGQAAQNKPPGRAQRTPDTAA